MNRTAFLAVLAGAGTFLTLGSARLSAATTVVGTGSAVSYLVLQSANIGSQTYEIHYTYNPAAPLDGYTLLQMADLADDNLSVAAVDYGDETHSNWFVSSITWNGITETNASDFSTYWAQWVSGGESGYAVPAPIADGTWAYGEGLSYRLAAPGTWDGLVFSDGSGPPSVSPVPEPSAALLMLLGAMPFFRRRRA